MTKALTRARDLQAPALLRLPPPPRRSSAARAFGGSLVAAAATGTATILVLGGQFIGGFNWEPLALTGVGLLGASGAPLLSTMGRRERKAFRAQVLTSLAPFVEDQKDRTALAAYVEALAPKLVPTYGREDHVIGNWRLRIETSGEVQLAARTLDDNGKTDWTTVATGGAR